MVLLGPNYAQVVANGSTKDIKGGLRVFVEVKHVVVLKKLKTVFMDMLNRVAC